MQNIFIGRERELAHIDQLVRTKSGAVFALQGESGSGKSSLVEKLRRKYHQPSQFFLNCERLPFIESASEFLLYLSHQSSGLKNLATVAKKINLSNKIDNKAERLLLDALVKDCKSRPIIFVDGYENLREGSHIFTQRITCSYSRFNQQKNTETILYSEWVMRLLQFLKQQGVLLIITGIKLEGWEKTQTLNAFNEQEILSFAKALELNNAIAENQFSVIKILRTLSFGGNPLWLRFACHFLIMELNNGKSLGTLIHADIVENIYQADTSLKQEVCKLALLKLIMPPYLENSYLIALPNYLDSETLHALFGGKGKILHHTLNNLGLLSISSVNANYLELHNEIKTLLLNDINSQGILKSSDIKDKHQALAVLYQHRYLKRVFKDKLILIELLYHQLMAGSNIEIELEQLKRPPIFIALICALRKTTEYNCMAQVFVRFIAIEPKHNEAWYSLGLTLSKQGCFKESLLAYKMQLHLNPEHDAAWKNMGFSLYQLGEVEHAVSAYQKKTSILAQEMQSWEKTLIFLYQQNNLKQSLNDYQQKLTQEPKHETVNHNLGVIFKKLARINEAVAAYKAQLKIDPLNDRTWNNIATVLFQQGKYEHAHLAFNRALKINPSNLYALTNDAELALIEHDKSRCLQRVDKIMSLVSEEDEEFTVSPFFVWLSSPKQRHQAILMAISKRQPNNDFDWSFKELEPVVAQLDEEQQKIARCFIRYFSNDLSFSGLRRELKKNESKKTDD